MSTKAVDLVLETTVIDMLGLLTLDWPKLFRWHRQPESFGLTDLRELATLGVDIFHPAVETSSRDRRAGADRWLRGWNRLLRAGPCFLSEIATITDLLTVPDQGRIGVLVGFQNADHFSSTEDVERYHDRGQRVSQLTYNHRNPLGSGCLAARDSGLTSFGSDIVAAMNRVGMAVDVSHCAERTSLDAIGTSNRPVLVTHSNCKTLTPGQPRCKSDHVIRAMAKTGGVMGMTIVSPFVKRGGGANLRDLLDHFEHAARLVGVEHVGLGSDVDPQALDPATGRPHPLYAIAGLQPSARVFQIADGLLSRGFTADHVRLVLGDNFRRALADIWPDDSWRTLPETARRRDPFCPTLSAQGPGEDIARGAPSASSGSS